MGSFKQTDKCDFVWTRVVDIDIYKQKYCTK